MNIVLCKMITNYFEIETIIFMIDTSYKFVLDNTDMNIQKMCPVCNCWHYLPGPVCNCWHFLPVTMCCYIQLWKCHQNTSNLYTVRYNCIYWNTWSHLKAVWKLSVDHIDTLLLVDYHQLKKWQNVLLWLPIFAFNSIKVWILWLVSRRS